MKILLTGGTGFLGSHIAELLHQKDYQLRCLVRPSSDLSFLKTLPSIEFICGSFDDAHFLRQAVSDVDAIIHNAGVTHAMKAWDFYRGNVDTTVNLLNAAAQSAPFLKKFILISSLAAAGPSSQQAHSEDLPPAPVSFYGHSKLIAENKTLEYKNQFPVTIIRPPVLYGPRDKKTFLIFKTAKWRLHFLPLRGQTTLSVLHVKDAAQAVSQALTCSVPSGSIYYIEDGKTYRWAELLHQLAEAIAKPTRVNISLPLVFLNTAAFLSERLLKKPSLLSYDKLNELKQSHWTCDSSKARQELAWRPQFDWNSGTKQTYDWYRQEKWL